MSEQFNESSTSLLDMNYAGLSACYITPNEQLNTVPTMGNLRGASCSLIAIAASQCDLNNYSWLAEHYFSDSVASIWDAN